MPAEITETMAKLHTVILTKEYSAVLDRCRSVTTAEKHPPPVPSLPSSPSLTLFIYSTGFVTSDPRVQTEAPLHFPFEDAALEASMLCHNLTG